MAVCKQLALVMLVALWALDSPGLAAAQASELMMPVGSPLALTSEEQTWLGNHSSIRVGFWTNAAPVLFRDDEGKAIGVTADYLELANAHLDNRLKVVFFKSFAAARGAYEKGQVDVLAAVTPNKNNMGAYLFTRSYLEMPVVLVTREKAPPIGGLANLAGKKVVVNKGHVTATWIKRDYPKVRLVLTESYVTGLRMVSHGEADAYAGAMLTLIHFSRRDKISNLKIAATTKYAYRLSMAVRTDWPVLAGILDKTLATVGEPEKNAIYGKWVSMRFEHGIDWTLVWTVAGALALVVSLVVVVILVWNRRLAREVRRRELAEAEAQASRERLAKTFDAQMDAILVLDAEISPTIVEVNRAACELFGLTRELLVGRKTSILHVNRASQARIRHALKAPEAVGNRHAHVNDIQLKRADGGFFDAEISVAKITGDQGRLVGWVSVVRDLSRAKAAQKERQRVFDLSVDPVCVAGLDGYFRELNNSWTRVLGWSQEELKAKPWIEFVHPEDVESTVGAGMALAQGADIVGFENRYLCKDGSYRWLAWNSTVAEENQLVYAVARDITNNKRMELELIRLASTDEMTGAFNRRRFLEQAHLEFDRAGRYGSSLSVSMLDLDHFKKVNDTLGHEAGDIALKELSRLCIKSLRSTDVFGRLGGEEFAVLLPETGIQAARETAERLRRDIEDLIFVTSGGREFKITASLGVSQLQRGDISFEEVLRRADKALYQAKQAGRNRVAMLE